MMFGTFRNPKAWDAKCGFAEDRELRVGELLLGRDVNAAIPPRDVAVRDVPA